VAHLKDGLKGLEKRFAKLLVTVSIMAEDAAKTATNEIGLNRALSS
jgi:hypothetical protein